MFTNLKQNIFFQANINEAQFIKTLSIFNSICQTKLNISDGILIVHGKFS